jgi:hypothetical protein
VARAHDPGVVETASDLTMPELTVLTAPRPAHLNDIAAMHWERFLYWREPGGMGWVKAQPYGRASEPKLVPLEGARLVEPALQSRAGALHALWLDAGSVSWVQIDGQGNATSRSFPLGPRLPLRAVAAWGRSEEPVTVTLFLLEVDGKLRTVRLPDGEQAVLQETKAAPFELIIDQWMGLASVHLVTHEREEQPKPAERLRIARWSVDDGAVAAGAGWTAPLSEDALMLGQLRTAVALPDGLALLFERPFGWTVCTDSVRAEISPPTPGALSRPPRLVATPRHGVHFVFHEPARGFSALPVFE